jgi:predicted aspartyl protease
MINTIKNLFFFTLLTTMFGCSQRVTNKIVDNNLSNLLESKEYFKLKDELAKRENEITEDRVLYYNVFINKAFGEREKSNHDITLLFQKYPKTLNDTTTLKLLDIQASNFLYLYQYKNAEDIYNNILTNYSKILDSSDVANYKNVKNLFGTFANIKPQKIHKQKDLSLHAYRNKFNHLMTSVKVDTTNEDFIFDTGANLSTITESQAKKMKLKVFEQNVEIGSSTQKEIRSKLAVADSLYVGEILFENVLFIVMPDEQLTFPQVNYSIKGIIGFPVIHQLGEVHLSKDGKIFVPRVATIKATQNMFFEGLNPVVKVFSENDTLLFTFDTGAGHTELSFKYYNEHKTEVEKKGEMQTNERGGAGGKVEVKEYILSNFPLGIGSHKTSLDKIPVTLEEYDFNKYFDGNLGQDFFMKFNNLIINFESMYIDFN